MPWKRVSLWTVQTTCIVRDLYMIRLRKYNVQYKKRWVSVSREHLFNLQVKEVLPSSNRKGEPPIVQAVYHSLTL